MQRRQRLQEAWEEEMNKEQRKYMRWLKKEREKRSMTIRIIVPRWTQAQLYLPVIAFDYYTLPEIDETFYNPYTDPREVVE